MKKLFVILIFFAQISKSQPFCDCLSIIGDKSFTGFCTEYLDFRLLLSVKEEAKFKSYFFYVNGKRARVYPLLYFLKSDKITLNESNLISTDSVTLLNGYYKIADKKQRVYAECIYKDGFIVKYIDKNETVYRDKKKGDFVHEISEYKYSSYPLIHHYNYFNKDGTIKYNYINKFDRIDFYAENTDVLLSP